MIPTPSSLRIGVLSGHQEAARSVLGRPALPSLLDFILSTHRSIDQFFFNYPLTGETELMFWSTIPSYTEAGMSKLSGMLAVFPLPNRFARLMVSASGWPLSRSIHCIAAVRVQV